MKKIVLLIVVFINFAAFQFGGNAFAADKVINSSVVQSATFAPYGTAKVDMHESPKIDVIFDVNYENPNSLNVLYAFVKNTQKRLLRLCKQIVFDYYINCNDS